VSTVDENKGKINRRDRGGGGVLAGGNVSRRRDLGRKRPPRRIAIPVGVFPFSFLFFFFGLSLFLLL
jgi:hypothetical protein